MRYEKVIDTVQGIDGIEFAKDESKNFIYITSCSSLKPWY